MKTTTLLIILTGLLSFAEGAAQNTRQYTLYVNSHRAQCQGEALMNCLVVRKDTLAGTPWEWMHTHIEGFDYKPGYLYTLRIEEEDLPRHKVPADGSSKRYRLLKMIDKSPDLRLRINDLWVLTQMKGEDVDGLIGPERPYMEFHIAEMRYMGMDGCNRFEGSIERLDHNTLGLVSGAVTEMHCGNEQISAPFRAQLGQVRGYEIGGRHLVLTDKSGAELLRFKKVD